MKNKKKILFASVLLSLSGCASSVKKIPVVDVSSPDTGVLSSTGLGDTIIKKGKGYYTDSITLGSAENYAGIIKAGKFCRVSESSNTFSYLGNDQVVYQKNAFGSVLPAKGTTLYGHAFLVDGRTVDYNGKKVCIPGSMGVGCFTEGEISISFKSKDVCFNPNSLVQSIEYNGRSGNEVNFTYREFTNSMARSAFTTDFKVDLSEGNRVTYKGAEFEIVDAGNNKIDYKVISYFR